MLVGISVIVPRIIDELPKLSLEEIGEGLTTITPLPIVAFPNASKEDIPEGERTTPPPPLPSSKSSDIYYSQPNTGVTR